MHPETTDPDRTCMRNFLTHHLLPAFLCIWFACFPAAGNETAKVFLKGMDAFDRGHYKRSIKIFKRILKDNSNLSQMSRVQYQIGLAYEAMGKDQKAFEAYETIFRKYPDIRNPDEIIERQFNLAMAFQQRKEDRLLGIDFKESSKRALEIFEAVTRNSPYGPFAEKAMLKAIHIQLDRKEYELALEKINAFKKGYETSPLLDEIHFLEGVVYFRQKKNTDRDQINTREALDKFSFYLKEHPDGAFKAEAEKNLATLREMLSEYYYQTGDFYLRHGQNESAAKYFKDIIEQFPQSRYAEKAAENLALPTGL